MLSMQAAVLTLRDPIGPVCHACSKSCLSMTVALSLAAWKPILKQSTACKHTAPYCVGVSRCSATGRLC